MSCRTIAVLLIVLAAVLRISAPHDLFEGSQYKQVAYVMDILVHGRWLLQEEVSGVVATKPPVYNWVAATFCLAAGSHDVWLIKLPALLSALALAALVFDLARRLFGRGAGVLALTAMISSHHFIKLMWFARTDMMMTLTVWAAIHIALFVRPSTVRALAIGVVLGISALVKGPVGPALFAAFLVARLATGERPAPGWGRRAALAGAVFVAIAGTWLVQVWNLPGFRETVIEGELVDRVSGKTPRTQPFYYPPLYLISRILPWSLLAIATAVVLRRGPHRRAIAFLALMAGLQLAMFMAIPVKRHDHVFPIHPAFWALCGLGLREALSAASRLPLRLLTHPVALLLVVAAAALPFGAFRSPPAATAMLLAAAAVAIAAAVLVERDRRRLVPYVLAAAIVLANGFYYHGPAPADEVAFEDVEVFVQDALVRAGADDLVIYDAPGLVSYAAGRHGRLPAADEVAALDAEWFLAPLDRRDELETLLGVPLIEHVRFVSRPDREPFSLALFRR